MKAERTVGFPAKQRRISGKETVGFPAKQRRISGKVFPEIANPVLAKMASKK